MNKKNIFLSFFIFSFLFPNVFSAIEREFSLKLVKTIESKEEIKKRVKSGELSEDNAMALLVSEVSEEEKKLMEKEGSKSIEGKITQVEFDKTAFGVENKFYLGSGIPLASAKSYAITLAQLVPDSNTGKSIVDFGAFAPQLIVVNNDIDEDKKPQKTENPIYAQKVEQLTLDSSSNVVASFNRNTSGGDNKEPQVCLTRSDLSALFTHRKNDNIVDINDASGTDVASGVVGLCAGSGKIFAAVTPKDETDFGKPNSGFAVLVSKRSDIEDSVEERLSIVNANNGMIDGNTAFELDLSSDQMVAIDTDAKISGLGDMYWDSTLQRLFIVLTGATQDVTANDGGAVCLLVGRLDGDKLILESSVELDGSFFKKNDTGNNVVGFYADDNNQYYASGYKVRVMHTSTGFSYLIINGGKETTDEGGERASVYALPIVKKNNDKEKIGKISQKDNFNEVIAAADQLLDVDDADDKKLAFVGNANLPLTPGGTDNETVEHLFVEGDSVFVCLAGDRNTNQNEAGIFKSTALFDENGKIFAWTAWQRVMGSTDVVYGGGLDRGLSANSGNYWYLTKDSDNKKTTVKVTQWGVGEGSASMMGQHLVPFLSDQFPHEIAGVHQVFNFDEQTPGFNTDAFSMMIAAGYKKVILLETGSSSGGAFNPTPDFSDSDKYKIFESDSVLNEIGPICCAQTSRIVNDGNKGWFFVGGYGGLAVLSDAAGDGWDTNAGLSNLTPNLDGFTFKKVHNFSHVRKLICDGVTKKLYVVGDQTIARISTYDNTFVIEATININDIVGNNVDFISDFMICGDLGLVATISGLFKADDINTAPTTWEEVKIDSGVVGVGQISIGPVQSFNFVSNSRGGVVTEGNLYVLLADIGLDLATVYRFQIKDNDIKRIKEDDDRRYFYQIGEFRSNFVQDGVFGFHLLSKHFDRIGFLKKLNIGSNVSTFRTSERIIDLDVEDELAYNVGLMVKNSATGAWVVPGDWGIRVQE